MQTLNADPFVDNYRTLIYSMIRSSLSNVPFHNDTRAVTRYIAKDFPFHLAVHEISPIASPPEAYTQPHIHDDADEINIILSHHDLLYNIQVGDEQHMVSNNSCVYIPRGVVHSANVIKGYGYFITIRIENNQAASGN